MPFIVIPVVALTFLEPDGFRTPVASMVIDAQAALAALTVTVFPLPILTISPAFGYVAVLVELE